MSIADVTQLTTQVRKCYFWINYRQNNVARRQVLQLSQDRIAAADGEEERKIKGKTKELIYCNGPAGFEEVRWCSAFY